MITDWDEKSHPYQRLPEPIAEGHKNIWSLIFGRRAGKTKAASAAISEFAVTNDDAPIGVVAPTYRKLTEVNFQSEVGLLNHIPKELIVSSTISPPKIKLFNGAEIFGFTADVKDTLRGRGLKAVWGDELTEWKYKEIWDEIKTVCSESANPLIIASTTPPEMVNNIDMWKLLKSFIDGEDPRVHVTKGTTLENTALDPGYLDDVRRILKDGFIRDRVEFLAEICDEIPGALWNKEVLRRTRVESVPCDLQRVIVGVDPAVSSGEHSDHTGIFVVGEGVDGHQYFLDDATMKGEPDEWAKVVVNKYTEWRADLVVGEVNNGGDLIENTLRTQKVDLPYKKVTATRGKIKRAEPIAALFKTGTAHLVGHFPVLEQQMTMFTPMSKESPDNLDAAIWAAHELHDNKVGPGIGGIA